MTPAELARMREFVEGLTKEELERLKAELAKRKEKR